MGITSSKTVYCNNCNEESGNTPIFYLYNDDKYSEKYLCNICYLNKDKICYHSILNDKPKKNKNYIVCNNCNTNKCNISYVKIYWDGKYKNKIFCNECLINKSYRKQKKI